MPRSSATAAAVLAIVLLNILLRVIPLPDIDLDVDLPPVAVPGWVHALVTIKNVAFGFLIAFAVTGFVLKELEAHRRRRDG